MAFGQSPFPFSGQNRMKLSGREYLIYGGLAFLFLGLIVLYVFEFEYFNRYLGAKWLVLGSLAVGVLLGGFVGYLYQSKAKDLTERIQLYIFFIVLFMIFMPLFGSLSNRLLSFQPMAVERVEFVKEQAFFSSRFGVMKGEKIKPTGFYLFFYFKERLYRIENENPWFPNSQRGDIIDLPIKNGFWGVSYVPPKALEKNRKRI